MLPQNLLVRRKAEERYESASRMVAERQRVEGVVMFEHRTDAAIERGLVRKAVAVKNAQLRNQVDERRAKLAALLEAEKSEYEREIEATFEPPEVVKQRMFAYARQLRDEREAARKKLAQELEDKRFRLSSDVLRARASAITAERTALDRVSQLQEKARLRQLEEEEERKHADAVIAHSKGAVGAARVQAEARRRLAAEMASTLNQQVAVKQDLRYADRSHEDGIVRSMLDADAAAAAAQRQGDIDRRQQARDEYERTMQYNAKEREIKAGAARREFEADKASLDATLKREAEEAAVERQKLIARRAQGLEFKAQLEQQMSIAEEDKGWMDKYYADEFEKEWAKRQSKWDAEAAARKALMQEVSSTRALQMQDRVRQADIERSRDEAQVAAWRATQAEADRREAEKQAARRAALQLQAGYAKQQLEESERARAVAKQEEYLEWRLAQKFEKQYETRVQALLRDPMSLTTTSNARSKSMAL